MATLTQDRPTVKPTADLEPANSADWPDWCDAHTWELGPAEPEPYEPTEADWADYVAWCAEREARELALEMAREEAREEALGALIPGKNLWFDGVMPPDLARTIAGTSQVGHPE